MSDVIDNAVKAVNDLALENRKLRARIEFLETQLTPDHKTHVWLPRDPTVDMFQAVIDANRSGVPYIEIAKEYFVAGRVYAAMVNASMTDEGHK